MKIDVRWQLLLAIICIALVWSILGYQLQTVGLCTTRVPSSGGRLSEGMVGQPAHINPLLQDGNPVDESLSALIFDGLVKYNDSGVMEPVLSESWEVSEDGLSIVFNLRNDVSWHDDQPFSADDVVFTYRLLQQDLFPIPEGLRELWRNVEINLISSTQVEFVLPQHYGPFLDSVTRGILPEHIFGGTPTENIADHPFNNSPIGTGPFMVSDGSDLRRDGRLWLSPNTDYWGQGTQIDAIEYIFLEDEDALLAAFENGELQAVTSVSPSVIPQIATIEGARLFSYPAPKLTQLLFNLTDENSPIVSDLAVREALSVALDREALIDGSLNGQGLVIEGPYLPNSWAYRPSIMRSFSYDPSTSISKLDSLGWSIPEGSTKRQKDGQLLTIRLLAMDTPLHRSLSEALKGQWMHVGIETDIEIVPASEMRQTLTQREFDVALIDVEPKGDPDLYDFWSQEAIVRGQNFGGWNNRRASEMLETARKLYTIGDRSPYYESFLRLFSEELPALTLFQHVYTYALSDSVQNIDVGRIEESRDRYKSLPNWFLLYREISIPCPD